MANKAPQSITQEKANAYDSFYEVFTHLYKELKALGMKKPSDTLSASKVSIVNRLLQDIREIMEGEPEHKYLDLLDDESLPQYSDAILVLSQYEGALKGFKERYYGYDSILYEDKWNII
ncbi:MAG: hypothetical protein QNJ94_18110 [Alphaproteobacteria bacterium]|nr:hypothetical protein [Alphaproteobacteria bacterium]